jgi:hypothetical protein
MVRSSNSKKPKHTKREGRQIEERRK